MLPLLGNLLDMRRLKRELRHQHLMLTRLAELYGPVVGLKLGSSLVVSVSGYEAIQEVLGRQEFLQRPDNFFIRLRTFGTKKGWYSFF